MFMNIVEKFDKLNSWYSYNIFAFNGFIILLTKLYLFYYYTSCMQKYGQGSWLASMSWLAFALACIIFAIFTIAFIVWIFEFVFNFKINNPLFSNNKIIKIIKYIGVAISLIYLVYNVTMLLYTLFIESFFPSDLIYFDIHSK